MKVRWNEASLRLRITPSELAALEQGEEIAQRLWVTPNFGWAVTVRPNAPQTALIADGAAVAVMLSPDDLEALARPDAEGVYFRQERPSGVRYYLEKDFPCTHPRAGEAAEVEAETFPGPASAVEFEISSIQSANP